MSVVKTTKPKDMFCFKEVASIIGEEQAEIELGKVIKDFYGFGMYSYETLISEKLINSFPWSSSPQRAGFWCDIDDKLDELGIETNPEAHFTYKNWKGVTSKRVVINPELVYTSSKYHGNEEQWFIKATDVEKGEERLFCCKDIVWD